MTPSEISTLVATIGFPIVAAWFLGQFTKSRIEAADKQAERRESVAEAREIRIVTAAEAREAKLNERVGHLEETMRTELMAVVTDAKEMMQQCSGTLAACTVAMQDMRDESKHRV